MEFSEEFCAGFAEKVGVELGLEGPKRTVLRQRCVQDFGPFIDVCDVTHKRFPNFYAYLERERGANTAESR